MLRWKVGDVIRYRERVYPDLPPMTIKEIKDNCVMDNTDEECKSCCGLRVVLSNTNEVLEGELCGGPEHCRLVRRTYRTHKETITNLRLPHLKEYLEVIGK